MKNAIIRELGIKEIKPYWRNPRDNKAAIDKVKKSIEQYGYNQPICIDKNNVIIAGHTRYKALLDLGYEKVMVMEADLTPKEAKAYRILDNRTNEFAAWSDDLKLELREIGDAAFISEFFGKDFNLDLDLGDLDRMTSEKIAATSANLDKQFSDRVKASNLDVQDVNCPECGHEFSVQLNKSLRGV